VRRRADAYECHLGVDRGEGGVFDTVSEEPEEQVKAVEGERREDPGAGVGRVVAYRDEERDVAEDAEQPIRQTIVRKKQTLHSLHDEERLIQPLSHRLERAEHNHA
jgi:hypothetical protein